MSYQPNPHAMAVTAMNILDGINHHEHWETLQPAWEARGMGFTEFCGWIVGIAEHSEKRLEQRAPQNFPGVYDYEVAETLGSRILAHVSGTGELPSDEDVLHWLTVLADEFFEQGERT